MIELLSTRRLTGEQQALLPPGEFHLEQYDALEITYRQANLDSDDEALCIFTSRHAVAACFPDGRLPDRMLNCCCVGRKTASLLEQMGHRILAAEDNAADLATRIINKYAGRSFIYFCSNRRLDTLPQRLAEAGVRLEERVVYETGLNASIFGRSFDAVLFFSPSGVASFMTSNALHGAMPVCIGRTTAQAVAKHTDKFIIAETPTVEGVLTAARKLVADKNEA